MFVKFQHFDASSFQVLCFTKTTPNIGLYSPPSRKQSQHLLLDPSGRAGINQKLGVEFSPKQRSRNIVKKSNPSKLADTDGKNGVSKDPNILFRNPDGRIENNRKNGDKFNKTSPEKKVRTKCSTKWLKYGGCVPSILAALERVSDLDEAMKPWEKTLSNKERSIILKEQVAWQRAMDIFQWFKRKGCYEVNVIHYNIMIRILGKARRWQEVDKLLEEMGERRIEPINSTYGTLIDVYSKGGFRERAIKWLELMHDRGMEPDEVTVGIVVQMFKTAGEFRKAEEFFKEWSLGKGINDCGSGDKQGIGVTNGDSEACVRLSSHTYNTLIDTYGKSGQVKEAREIFEKMLKEGIVPTTVTFNTLIHMYGKNCQLEEVASLIQKMVELQCPLDTRTYNILIFLHAKHDNITMAANYFKEMKRASLEPDIVSYRTLLYAFSIRHMVSEADELILEIDKRGLDIDEFTQSALTRMYIEAGMLGRAWLWFRRFHLAGNMSSECYSAIIDAFGERGHVFEAERVFYCCQERRKASVLEFNVMIKAYGISKKYLNACCLFDTMEEHNLCPDRCSYNSLIQMLATADLPQRASSYLRKMQKAGLVDDCIPYCAVISSFAKLGQVEMAVGLYREMIGFGVTPDIVLYGVLINAFADTGSVKEVQSYLAAMRNADLPINTVICNSLIKLYTKVGYLKEAEEIYASLKLSREGPDVYSSNCMIDLYSERSMVRNAEEIFENLTRKGDANEFSYAMMLRMYRKNGRFVEATCIAKKMRELGLLTDLLSFNNVLGLYASDGRFKEVAATVKEMLMSSIKPDESTFKSLGIVLLKCGVPKDAVSKLEHRSKKDAWTGLRVWSATLFSVIGIDDDDP